MNPHPAASPAIGQMVAHRQMVIMEPVSYTHLDVYKRQVQEPPASPKPKRTSRKKKEAAAPEETVTEEVPAETTESADTADSILDTEEPAVERCV